MLESVRQQIKSEIKTRLEEMADDMDLVPREDVERLEAVIARMQADIDELKQAKKK